MPFRIRLIVFHRMQVTSLRDELLGLSVVFPKSVESMTIKASELQDSVQVQNTESWVSMAWCDSFSEQIGSLDEQTLSGRGQIKTGQITTHEADFWVSIRAFCATKTDGKLGRKPSIGQKPKISYQTVVSSGNLFLESANLKAKTKSSTDIQWQPIFLRILRILCGFAVIVDPLPLLAISGIPRYDRDYWPGRIK